MTPRPHPATVASDIASVSTPRPSISVVIACRDEAPTIGGVIARCREYSSEIIVVDGHSSDGTLAIAEREGAKVVEDSGRGKGEAMRLGLQRATGEIIVFIDADGSHDPGDIPRLVQPLVEGRADLVIGSRMRGGSDELHGSMAETMRTIGSAVITAGINYRFGVKLSDTQNGFRAIRAQAARGLGLVEDITTIEQEMVIKAIHAKLRIAEVPSHEYARSHGRSRILLRDVWFRYVYSWLKYLVMPR